MSNELMVQEKNKLMKCFDDPQPWKVDFLGHSEYQFRNFIIKHGNPTADTQYKQACREAWSRMQALRQARYVGQQNQAKLLIAEAELMRLEEKEGWEARKLEGEKLLQKAEIENLEGSMAELKLDIENRILREARLSLKVLSELRPASDDRMAVEEDNWTKRAETVPQLKELIQGGK